MHELEYLPAISALSAIAVRYFHPIGREIRSPTTSADTRGDYACYPHADHAVLAVLGPGNTIDGTRWRGVWLGDQEQVLDEIRGTRS
jgi:hypothetical protein